MPISIVGKDNKRSCIILMKFRQHFFFKGKMDKSSGELYLLNCISVICLLYL
jgi:hypothetical protein